MVIPEGTLKELRTLLNSGCPICGQGGMEGTKKTPTPFLLYVIVRTTEDWMLPRATTAAPTFNYTYKGEKVKATYVKCGFCSAILLNVTKNKFAPKVREVIDAKLEEPKKLATTLYKMSNDHFFISNDGVDEDASIFLKYQFQDLYKQYVQSLKACNMWIPNCSPPLNPDSISYDRLSELGLTFRGFRGRQ